MSCYQRSYAYAGNGVAFACTETSNDPLPPPSVPGIGGSERPGRAALGEVVAQLAVEPSDEARAAAVERARVAQLGQAQRVAMTVRERELHDVARQRWAIEQATVRPRPALAAVECPALESGRRRL